MREQYDAFIDALLAEPSASMATTGTRRIISRAACPSKRSPAVVRDTLRFGPMKPVGLRNPHTGNIPYAVVQLRQENLRADSYNLVGFQNHLKFGEQARVLRMIPGLENAKFLRYGQIHRNTYINAPALLDANPADEAASAPHLRRTNLRRRGLRRIHRHRPARRTHRRRRCATRAAEPIPAPRASAHGSLTHYICNADPKDFQPANITFDLLEQLDEATKRKVRDKKLRHQMVCERALAAFTDWFQQLPEVLPTR